MLSTLKDTVIIYISVYIYIYTALINPSEEAELDHILAGVDYTKCDEATEQPGSTPELLGAVRSPMNDSGSADVMAHCEGSGGELPIGGPSFSLSFTGQLLRIRSNSYTVISFC